MSQSEKDFKDFYISYDRVDRAWAEWIAWCLDETGYKVIIDTWSFRPGSNFVIEMNKAIGLAKKTIAILSPDYINGLYTNSQWAAAFARDSKGEQGKLIPIIVRECRIQGLLAQIVSINLIGLNESAAKQSLIEKIEGRFMKPVRSPQYPLNDRQVVSSHLAFPNPDPLLSDYIKVDRRDNAVAELFKMSFQSFREAINWIEDRALEQDFLTVAARRYSHQLEERYDSMRIFGMGRPVPLRSIYTRVNILEKITSTHRATIEDLESFFDLDRRAFGKTQKTEDGVQAVNRLDKCIVLGKPGAGKTTFLKYIVLQALDGNLAEKRIPLFVGLKDWTDSGLSLKDFLIQQFAVCNFPETSAFVERLLASGSCLILFDGLDEVSSSTEAVIQHILDFSYRYSANKFLLSCRIAAYNYWFEQYTDIELADFSDEQIETFIKNWFGEDTQTAELCWMKLVETKPIKELASIPLLLTMLCLAFDETLTFPPNKAELYKEAIDALLKKWDTSRRIKREQIYQNFSVSRKEAMFSQIAAATFENGQYFLPKRTLVEHIIEFIKHLPEINSDSLDLDGEAVLKSIEAQHGLFVERARSIYSFSHLTFQEYFTAKYYIDNTLEGKLKELVRSHVTDTKWNEVFLIVAGMLPRADSFLLLMKENIDSLMTKDLVTVLKPLENKIGQKEDFLVKKNMPLGAARAYALYRAFEHVQRDITLARARNTTLDVVQSLARNTCLDLFQLLGLEPSRQLTDTLDIDLDLTLFLKEKIAECLMTYIRGNYLLVRCLNSECYVSKDTRTRILNELLLIPKGVRQSSNQEQSPFMRFWRILVRQ